MRQLPALSPCPRFGREHVVLPIGDEAHSPGILARLFALAARAKCDKPPFGSFFARKFVPDGVWSSGYEFV